jgi:ethanolamine ammonia-lyase small subunit
MSLPVPAAERKADDPWADLRQHTPARIALGRAGTSLPTAERLRFAAAHALARDAVHVALDVPALAAELQADGWPLLHASGRAATRGEYLRRPDLGRRLDGASADRLAVASAPAFDLALVVGDGLAAVAAQRHAADTLRHLRAALAAGTNGGITLAPVVIATQARVALADEVGALLGARAVLILLGERPGLSSPDSLGAYLTFAPRLGRSDAERNCVSNIRPEGLPPAAAATRLAWLVQAALRRRLSGVALKDDSATPKLASASAVGAGDAPLAAFASLAGVTEPVLPASPIEPT